MTSIKIETKSRELSFAERPNMVGLLRYWRYTDIS